MLGVKVQIFWPLKDLLKARDELGIRNKRKTSKGNWKKPTLISKLNGPILLGIFGDPHLDNSDTDLDMFEDEIRWRDPKQEIHTCCVGDFFDNWPALWGICTLKVAIRTPLS